MASLLRAYTLLLVLLSLSTHASKNIYPEHMLFQNLMEAQNITLSQVESFLHDSDGFMWAGGSNGLLRYDGYEFLAIKYVDDPTDPSKNRYPSYVYDLYEDSQKRMWAITRSGVFIYDRSKEVLTRVNTSEQSSANLLEGEFNGIVETPEGDFLIPSMGGLYWLDGDSYEVQVIRINPEAFGLPQERSEEVNRMNRIVAGKSDCACYWLATHRGLSRFDLQTRSFKHYIPFPEKPDSIAENNAVAIDIDDGGNIWLGMQQNGVYRLDVRTEKFVHFKHDPKDPNTISDDLVLDVYKDSNGVMWIATDRAGINYYNKDEQKFTSFRHEEGAKGSLSTNNVRVVYEDRNGDLWMGHYPSGFSFHNRQSSAIRVYQNNPTNDQSLAVNLVTAIQEDADGNLWIGTDGGGVDFLDRKTGSFKHYDMHPQKGAKVPSVKVLSGLVDSDGDVWFGSWDSGFFRYNRTADKFDQIPFDKSLAGTNSGTTSQLNDVGVWGIYEDSQKTIWISTHSGGLSSYDKKNGLFTNYKMDMNDPKSLQANLIWTTFEDSQGRFWVATVSGLYLLDREKQTFKGYFDDESNPKSLSNRSVLSVYEDKKGRLWFGAQAGLNLYDESADNFTVFGSDDGFADSTIRSIEEDNNGNLWIGTSSGIVRFNPETKEVKNYLRYNGEKIGGFSTGGSLRTSREELIFGGEKGMRVFDLRNMSENTWIPPVVLTDFRVFTKSVPIGEDEDSLLKAVVNQTKEITLDYQQSMFSFVYAGLSFRDSEKNQYAYKLEGLDDDWREVGSQRRAVYTNLSGGNYVFRVKASNADGVWNDVGHAINIRQLPPPWLTWWAYTLYTLAVLSLILWFIHAQRKKRRLVEERNRELEVKVRERTAEITKKSLEIEKINNDIKAMLSNMRQGLFTIGRDNTIQREYSTYLEVIFDTSDIYGQDAFNFLFSSSLMGTDALDSAKEAIFATLGEEEMNFLFNSHLLVSEYETDINGSRKHINLDWNPIVVDDTIEKLMVTVRDVTQLIKMKAESEMKQRELDIIGQLLNVSHKKYINFRKVAVTFIQENRDAIKAHTEKDDDIVALLFRNMHTIKGNCRTFAFNHISNVVHDVESVYSNMKTTTEEGTPSAVWDQQTLLQDLERVEEILEEYHQIYMEVLGRSDSTEEREDGMWVNTVTLQGLHEQLANLQQHTPGVFETVSFKRIHSFFAKALSAPINIVLEDIVNSLPSIAKQLDKEEPVVKIDSGNIRVKNAIHELLTNVFSHLLRNSIDHGIEAPADRKEAGKAPQGSIEIYTSCDNKRLKIHVKDDGRGVNIDRLFAKGVDSGHWSGDDKPPTEAIANLIFESGISTKETVSDISGRGVGMDAVKQFVTAQGGDIYLNLLSKKTADNAYVNFETILELPEDTYTLIYSHD